MSKCKLIMEVTVPAKKAKTEGKKEAKKIIEK